MLAHHSQREIIMLLVHSAGLQRAVGRSPILPQRRAEPSCRLKRPPACSIQQSSHLSPMEVPRDATHWRPAYGSCKGSLMKQERPPDDSLE